MSQNIASCSAHRTARRCSIFAIVSLACILLPRESRAATARIRWLPSASTAITRYDVYVRSGDTPYGTPAWSGNASSTGDGALEALVPFTAAMSGVNYFAVVAVGATEESALSRELPLGTPAPCRIDSCTAKTTCDFGNVPDGQPCDLGDPDPCSAVCRDGVCGSTSGTDAVGTELTRDRLSFTSRSSGITLSLKGRFTTDATIDPASTGVVIELRADDGAVRWTSSIAGSSFTANATRRRFRFSASKKPSDPASSGLTRLDLRLSGQSWIVTAQAKTPELAEASAEASLTIVVRLGTNCVRRVGAECSQGMSHSMCR